LNNDPKEIKAAPKRWLICSPAYLRNRLNGSSKIVVLYGFFQLPAP
jgi:hypothetical protein